MRSKRFAAFDYVLGVLPLCVALIMLITPASAHAMPSTFPLPSQDPFDAYDGPLSAPAGTVLRARPTVFATPQVSTPVTGSQVLYRTTDQRGRPGTTVATVLPSPVPGPVKLLSFHMAYDALGSQCDPSYTLSGGPGSRVSTVEQGVIAGYLAAGYTVVVPDYEGPQLEWTIGRQSAYAALDGIRAAEAVLALPSSTPVALLGYSGGSVPTQWGAEVAADYAPELNIVGAAAGGLPVDLAHNLPYVSGSAQWAGVIPALVVAYQRTYDLDTAAFLSSWGQDITAHIDSQCIANFAGSYPGLTDADMVRPPYRSLLDVAPVVAAIDDNIMGTEGTPRMPLLLGVGQADPTGDTIMVTADVEGLAHRYCEQGATVTYSRYPGLGHGEAFAPFEADAAQFLAATFAGAPPHSDCAAIGAGNALSPIPIPAS